MRVFIYLLLTTFFCAGTALFAQEFNPFGTITATDRQSDAHFGQAVSISENYAIVGAIGTAPANTGTAYIYERTENGDWVAAQALRASDGENNDFFGFSVSISEKYAVVGAYSEDAEPNDGAGAAYVFERSRNGEWQEVIKLVAPEREESDMFGLSVSISGNYIIVGALGDDDDANSQHELSGAGAAYIYERNPVGDWIYVQKLVAPDREAEDLFGNPVSISGNYAVVGAVGEDEDANLRDKLEHAGSVYVFERNASGYWSFVQKVVPSDRGTKDLFGSTLDISGNYLIVGTTNETEDSSGNKDFTGSAYIFTRDDSTNRWFETQKLKASDGMPGDYFGISVNISNYYAVVGAAYEDEDAFGGNRIDGSGAAYIFKRDLNNRWSQVQKIVPNNREYFARFGGSTSLSGQYILVGALGADKDSSSSGSSLWDAGAAYFFKTNNVLSVEEKDFNGVVQSYPNPTLDYVTVDMGKVYPEIDVEITNVAGQRVLNTRMQNE